MHKRHGMGLCPLRVVTRTLTSFLSILGILCAHKGRKPPLNSVKYIFSFADGIDDA